MAGGLRIVALGLLVFGLAGCQRPMFSGQSGANNNWLGGPGDSATLFQRLPNGQSQYSTQQQIEQISQLSKQMSEMSQQLARFDTDNQGLHSQVASLQQRLDTANNYNVQLKQQLRDATVQLQQQSNGQQLANAPSTSAQPLSASPAGQHQFAGNATLRANNSLMGKLSPLQAAGVKASMDGDVIRIEFPSEQVFVPNTYQIQQGQQALFNNLATTIRQHFPEQFIGIESHWDQTPVQGSTNSLQQLTATQSLAVLNYLTQAGIPNQQMFTVGMGSNRPRYPNNASQNRRIEIVIYPETFRPSL